MRFTLARISRDNITKYGRALRKFLLGFVFSIVLASKFQLRFNKQMVRINKNRRLIIYMQQLLCRQNPSRPFFFPSFELRQEKLQKLAQRNKTLENQVRFFYELLFRHIFETQIHIQTQIRNTFILPLATNDFS